MSKDMSCSGDLFSLSSVKTLSNCLAEERIKGYAQYIQDTLNVYTCHSFNYLSLLVVWSGCGGCVYSCFLYW